MGLVCPSCGTSVDIVDGKKDDPIYCPICGRNLRGEYKDNEIEWKIGALVIHKADWKDERMLMRVIRIDSAEPVYNGIGLQIGKELVYLTEYVHPCHIKKIGQKFVKRKVFRNYKQYLLNPKDFGIKVPEENLWR